MAASDGQLSCPLGIRGHVNAILNDKYSMSWISYILWGSTVDTCEHYNHFQNSGICISADREMQIPPFWQGLWRSHASTLQCWLAHPAKIEIKDRLRKLSKLQIWPPLTANYLAHKSVCTLRSM